MVPRSALGLLCLLALSSAANSTTVETIYVKNGNNLELGEAARDSDQIESCVIHTNNGSVVKLYPDPDDTHKFEVSYYSKCKTAVYRMTESDSGNWTIIMTLKEGTVVKHQYNIYVREEYIQKTAYPSSKINVYENQFVTVHFNERFENLEHCNIISPQNVGYSLTSNQSTNIKLYGGCGVKMQITGDEADYNGKWTLIADLKNKTTFYTEFNVNVKNSSHLKPHVNTFIFKRGEKVLITFGDNQEAASKMCIIQSPKGEKMPITSAPCKYEITSVSEFHEGVWTAYYGVEGTETLVKQKIIIKTYADSYLNSSLTASTNGDVHLLCRVNTGKMEFCSFERPDGLLLHMSNGVGNEKYEYYGNGIREKGFIVSNPEINDCGITIHGPSSVDYGSWKCLIGIHEKSKIIGKFLKVLPPARSNIDIKSVPNSKDVYAKRGAPFKVKCSANEALSYCWLSSPNGTVHSVLNAGRPEPPALKYEGQGFDLGDCTASIEYANVSDAGKWTCHMGVVNGPELETSFKVHLKETHLMAEKDLVILENNQESDLICRPLPDSDKVIESCRWVNPYGHGINVDPEGRYITQTESTHCRLSFRVVNLDSDVGEWSCFARFTNLEEGSARMIVVYQSGSLTTFLSVALVISLLCCIALGVFILVLYKRRLALRRIDEKIILDEKPPKYP